MIGITRVASRWIGEYFIDEDRAARIAEEIDRYRIAIPSVRIDRQVYNSRAAQIRRHAHVNFIQSGHISRSNHGFRRDDAPADRNICLHGIARAGRENS